MRRDAKMYMFFRLLSVIIRQRRKQRLNIWDTSRTPFRVLPSDLDLLGHMNNSKYLSLMDLGRMDLMIRSGYAKKMQGLGWYPVVAAQTISYRRSLNPWVKFDLYSKVLGFSD
ncbi:MAG TPA: acyl-CoA thioesterase, partial [Microbacteriaceae bacterium]|nr:acyl-CoA thioesterase [Microbacteriaceae bacterium]